MRDRKKYEVWQIGHQLVLKVYKEVLPVLPADEKYGLASQIKRSAYSIPMNIAEGCGRNTDKDFAGFLDIAMGSVHELEYCLLLSAELMYFEKIKHEDLSGVLNELKAKLINLIKSIRK